jgi:hypothetical protein
MKKLMALCCACKPALKPNASSAIDAKMKKPVVLFIAFLPLIARLRQDLQAARFRTA